MTLPFDRKPARQCGDVVGWKLAGRRSAPAFPCVGGEAPNDEFSSHME
jgi:hypothetical protein